MKNRRKENKGQYIRFLQAYAWKKKLLIFYGIILAIIVLNASISLVRPRLQGDIIDDLSNPAGVKQSDFMVMLGIFLGMLIINYIIQYVQTYFVTVISEEMAADVRQKIHDKLATVKAGFFEKIEISDILLKVDKDVAAIKQCGITSILTLVSNVAILIVVPPYMFSIHKGIAISNIVLLICVPFISRILGRYIQKTSEKVLNGYNDATSVLTNSYNNWFIIRIFHCFQYIHEKYKKENQSYKHAINKQNLLYILNTMTILVVQFSGTVVIWVVGAQEIFKGNMTIGTIMALMNYQAIIMNPIIGIADFTNEYHTAVISLKDMNSLLEYPDEEREGKKQISHISTLKLLNVCFQYPEAETILLDNINISFQKGKVYAVHGNSGQGKSTLFKLITGIYQPTKGKIFVDNDCLRDCDLNCFWKHIGFVMQRSQFFKDSVSRNMGLDCRVPENKMDEVAIQLDLYEDIHSLTECWETQIKMDPYNFSEGQMRRMDIMRNILKTPDILVFDEATANIDERRRKRFYELLHQLSKDKIIIYSTHNQEELKEADVVLDLGEMQKGRNGGSNIH